MEFNTNNVIIYSTLVILVILVIYLLVRQKKNHENFDVNNNNISAITNLGTIAAQIMNTTTGTLTIPADNVDITGSLTAPSLTATKLTATSFNLLPSGLIVAYNSIIAPAGWALCDGTTPTGSSTPTPDLRGKFIIGNTGTNYTSTATSSTYTLGNTGGEEQHTLLVAEMPAHAHDMIANPNNSQWTGWNMQTWGLLGSANNTPSLPTTVTGGNTPHNNMPPYYVLVYIIKL